MKPMTGTQKWLLGIRPKTLPAAASPVLMGWSIAWSTGHFHWGAAIAALAGALLIQIGTNLVNDVMDFAKGADTQERLGPTRVTQSGLLSPAQVWAGVWLSFGLAAVSGIYLFTVAGWPVIWIGVFSLVAGFAYTAGPYPLAYIGLADLFVMVFFGFVSVCGTVYVTAGSLTNSAWWAGLAAGALAVNILVVNNIRDINTDLAAKRKNIPVVFGRRAAEFEYLLMLAVAYMVPGILIFLGESSRALLSVYLSLPRALSLFRVLRSGLEGRGLNQVLGQTAQLLFLYSVLFAFGFLLPKA